MKFYTPILGIKYTNGLEFGSPIIVKIREINFKIFRRVINIKIKKIEAKPPPEHVNCLCTLTPRGDK